jgi:hypothetical protein
MTCAAVTPCPTFFRASLLRHWRMPGLRREWHFGGFSGVAALNEEHVQSSFVARIWLERGSNGDPIWRGHIRHVQGKEESHFQDLQGMNELLEQVSGVPGLEPTRCLGKDVPVSKPDAAANGKPARPSVGARRGSVAVKENDD